MQFTSKDFQEGISVHGLRPAPAAPYNQEISIQAEVTWQTLRTITHSILVHARVSEKYINFALMYTTDHLLYVLPIKHLVNQDSEPTTPKKLSTVTKSSVSNMRVLFCPCVVKKATAHVDTKALKMRHQS